jgi:hypothetical protein
MEGGEAMNQDKAISDLLQDMENITAYYKRREATRADYQDMRNALDKYYKAVAGSDTHK